MHAIIFCINATCTSQDLNYQIQEHIAKFGILQDSQNSYNQMVLVGTKAETLDEVDRDNWVRYKAKPFFEKADRGEGNWCFTTPIGERDATTGQYPDLNTKDLEEILRTMPIRKIYFEAGFTDEFLRNMLETTSAVPPDQIEAIITEIPSRLFYPTTEPSLNKASYDSGVSRIGADQLTSSLFWQ